MKVYKLDKSKLNPKDGKQPPKPVGYLAPAVGTFTLFVKDAKGVLDTTKGQAAFVWFHMHDQPHGGHTHEHLVLDWHVHGLEYAGSTIDDNYWAYKIIDGGSDADVEFVLLAKTRTNSGIDHGGTSSTTDVDEGYRIFYVAHEEYHLWAWDARTFIGHDDAHDHP